MSFRKRRRSKRRPFETGSILDPERRLNRRSEKATIRLLAILEELDGKECAD